MFDMNFVMVHAIDFLSASTVILTLHSKEGTLSRILEVSQGNSKLIYDENGAEQADDQVEDY